MTSVALDPETARSRVLPQLLVRLSMSARPPRLEPVGVQDPSETSFRSEGDITVFLTGTLYNVPALLGPEAGDAASGADAALRAYRRWGTDLGRRAEGVFALVIWDAKRETLLCIRDALGTYPLFYASAGEDLLVSTSADALVREPGVSRTLDRDVIADHLCHRWPDRSETYYKAVKRLPPGHLVEIRRGAQHVSRYWNPVEPGGSVDWVREDELEQFDELLDQAIARGMALGPAGIFLSGGLDSVSIAAFAVDRARREGREEPWALSLIFPTAEANEEMVQRGVARGLGMRQALLGFHEAVSPDGVVADALELSADLPAPLLNIWFPAYRSLTAAGANRACKVIFTGGGGDEWLTVSPYLAADLLRSLDFRGLGRMWGMTSRSFRLSRLATLRSLLWNFGGRPLAGAALGRVSPTALTAYRARAMRRQTPEWIAPDVGLRRRIMERASRSARERERHGSFYLRESRLGLDHSLVSMEMEELYETGLRTGVPVRMPFWDAQLLGFLYRTPPDFLNEGGRAKGLVRQMLARKFPDLGFERHKKVLASNFFTQIMAEEAPRAWKRLGGAQALASLGIVDSSRLHSVVRDVLRENHHHDVSRIWNVLTVEAWVRSQLEAGGGD
jgi:asparagine synthase (glutamine-hydrolysing)